MADAKGQRKYAELGYIAAEVSKLSPSTIAAVEREIRHLALLHPYDIHRRSRVLKLFKIKSEQDVMLETEGLEYLYLFHGDGYLREAALDKLATPLNNPFLFTAVAYRLNDWVRDVRRAAHACALRCFPITKAEVIAVAALFLIEQKDAWRRWADVSSVLEETLRRGDVVACLAAEIKHRRNGPMGRVLRYALRSDLIDDHLPDLSVAAEQPAVRAAALQALIDGRATWPTGSAGANGSTNHST